MEYDGEPVGPVAVNVQSLGTVPPPETIFFNFSEVALRVLVISQVTSVVPAGTLILLSALTLTFLSQVQVPAV